MKKIFALALVIVVAVVYCANADDLDVQIISRKTTASEESDSMNFDNVTFGKAYKIKGYASINLLGFKFINMYAQWDDGKAGIRGEKGYVDEWLISDKKPHGNKCYYFYLYCDFKKSGKEAEFAWLKADVTNLQKTPASFIKEITVKVIFDDEYEYKGWVRQFNYDYSNSEIVYLGENSVIGWPVCLSPVDEMPISPMYKGHYAFGCTLPNYVVQDKDSPSAWKSLSEGTSSLTTYANRCKKPPHRRQQGGKVSMFSKP